MKRDEGRDECRETCRKGWRDGGRERMRDGGEIDRGAYIMTICEAAVACEK